MLLEFILDSTSLIFMSKDNDMDLLSLKDGSRLKAYPIKQLGSWEPSISICRLSHSHWIAYFHSFMALETFTIDVDSQTLLSASQGCGHPWLLSTTKALFGHGNRSLLAQSSCPGGLRQRCLTESGQHRHGPTRSDSDGWAQWAQWMFRRGFGVFQWQHLRVPWKVPCLSWGLVCLVCRWTF